MSRHVRSIGGDRGIIAIGLMNSRIRRRLQRDIRPQ
jgi:hypothetical protein